MKLYNTLTRKVEEFVPLNPPKVGMYTCGPTVYSYTHIGHLRKYIADDVLRRLLVADGYKVKQVMNITDVGHLVSDADEGEDKLEKGAREQGKTVWQVAKFFKDYFFNSTDCVNILRPNIVAPATAHIEDQIKLIQRLENNGYTYRTDQAVYFDVSKFPNYTRLSGQKLAEQQVGVRQEVMVDKSKKNPQDFALWFFTVGRFNDHVMRWSSPWGEGFPGWHIECSAMSMKYLGETIDIHTGGIDHIAVHHTNEIAQSEGATGRQFVRYWVHHGWLLIDGEKMSKSKNNFYTIDNIKEKGFKPLAFRYLVLTAHYRDQLNFTWESLGAAQNAYDRLVDFLSAEKFPAEGEARQRRQSIEKYREQFFNQLNDDIGTPGAIAVMWEVAKSSITHRDKQELLLSFDKVLGLGLAGVGPGRVEEIDRAVRELVEQRETLRKDHKWAQADAVRKRIELKGYQIIDSKIGTDIKKVKH